VSERVRRVFYAHRASASIEAVESACALLQTTLQKRTTTVEIDVISGRDDFTARNRQHRSPHDWARSCSEIVYDEPRFHAFVVPDAEKIGSLTVIMLRTALSARRSVKWWNGKADPDAVFMAVASINGTSLVIAAEETVGGSGVAKPTAVLRKTLDVAALRRKLEGGE